jgi:curved DNA-binding protein CbpA
MSPSRSPLPDDLYHVLGVSHDATPSEITAAYRALVRDLHPDAQHEPVDPARLTAVVAAYAQLRDPRRRASYDSELSLSPPPDPGPTSIPVRVHRRDTRRQPDIQVGPVRRHLT